MGGEGNVVAETNKLCGVAAAKPMTPHTIGISGATKSVARACDKFGIILTRLRMICLKGFLDEACGY